MWIEVVGASRVGNVMMSDFKLFLCHTCRGNLYKGGFAIGILAHIYNIVS